MFSLDEIKNYPVNWVDGMRVSAKDFEATDRAWNDAIRDTRISILQGMQFGLLPALRDYRDEANYPKFHFDASRNMLTLLECRAITEGGYRIEITENLHHQYKAPVALPFVRLDAREDLEIYITVHTQKKQPVGEMTTDAPPRYVRVTPYYELSVLAKSDGLALSETNHLKIAEYRWGNNIYSLDEHYIPPCMTMNAHRRLLERHTYMGGRLKGIHENSIKLINQYRGDARNDVREAVIWLEKVITHISSGLWTYNDMLPGQSPKHTVVFVKNIAQVILSTAEMHQSNLYVKDGMKTWAVLMKGIADPNFNDADLRTAFMRITDAFNGFYKWLKSLEESLRQGRVIKVEKDI